MDGDRSRARAIPDCTAAIPYSQRRLEASCQRVTARLLGFDRLLEERLAAARLVGKNARGFAQLRLVAALRLLVRDDTSEVGVDHEQRAAARTLHFKLAFQLRHT